MHTATNITLKVPFNEKDQAKSLGAKWNAEAKHWYVPAGVDATPFEKWFTSSPNLVAKQSAAKPVGPANTGVINQNASIDDDIDAINARLRDAYEPLDGDPF